MLKLGNRKLGPKVYTWSLPVVKTCPGASAACLAVCYAKTGYLAYPSVIASHKKNLAASRRQDFVARMSHEIRECLAERVRIHVAGDFYSVNYVEAWRQIVNRHPDVSFLAYTRSWTDDELWPSLRRLGREPNMALWLSFDKSMPRPPRRGLPICYLSQGDDDLPRGKVNLVFRHRVRTVMKKTPTGNQVCPYETGATKTTCSQCTLCWSQRPGLVQLETVRCLK